MTIPQLDVLPTSPPHAITASAASVSAMATVSQSFSVVVNFRFIFNSN